MMQESAVKRKKYTAPREYPLAAQPGMQVEEEQKKNPKKEQDPNLTFGQQTNRKLHYTIYCSFSFVAFVFKATYLNSLMANWSR